MALVHRRSLLALVSAGMILTGVGCGASSTPSPTTAAAAVSAQPSAVAHASPTASPAQQPSVASATASASAVAIASTSPTSTAEPPSGPPSTPRPKCPNIESGNTNQCLGPIAAGTYTTVVFHPTLTYTVPDGWSNMEDMAGNFLLLPPGADLNGVDSNGADYLGVYTSVVAPSLCTGEASTTVEHTFDALVNHTQNNPLLKVTNVHDVTTGGLTGVEMDLRMKPGPGDGCSDGVWVDIYVGQRPTDLVHSALPGNNMRIAFLRNGEATLAVEVTDIDQGGSDINDWKSSADAVAQTFEFASGT